MALQGDFVTITSENIGEIPKVLNLLFTKWKEYAEEHKEDY